ncbi:MAG: C_GCAxxG_C_C family protein [Blautia sp.]|nr:C_GCAxxG_C_C family protein [Blautia sp.]
MESRIEQTIIRHDKGYNCAQAVACTYCDLVGMSEKDAFRATEAFGAGMGGMSATCGAVSGAVFIAGLKNSTANLNAPDSKGRSYKVSRDVTAAFKARNGSLICGELKGLATGKVLRSCPDCIKDAAELVETMIL